MCDVRAGGPLRPRAPDQAPDTARSTVPATLSVVDSILHATPRGVKSNLSPSRSTLSINPTESGADLFPALTPTGSYRDRTRGRRCSHRRRHPPPTRQYDLTPSGNATRTTAERTGNRSLRPRAHRNGRWKHGGPTRGPAPRAPRTQHSLERGYQMPRTQRPTPISSHIAPPAATPHRPTSRPVSTIPNGLERTRGRTEHTVDRTGVRDRRIGAARTHLSGNRGTALHLGRNRGTSRRAYPASDRRRFTLGVIVNAPRHETRQGMPPA